MCRALRGCTPCFNPPCTQPCLSTARESREWCPPAQSSPGSAFLSHISVYRHLPAKSAPDLPVPYPVAFTHSVRQMKLWSWAGYNEGNAAAASPKLCCPLSFLFPWSLLLSPHFPQFKLNLFASSLSVVLFPFKKTPCQCSLFFTEPCGYFFSHGKAAEWSSPMCCLWPC